MVSQLRAGLDVCSFLQLTPIRDKTAFFVSFNSLTKQFSIIGNTHMLRKASADVLAIFFSSHVNLVNLQQARKPRSYASSKLRLTVYKEFHLMDLKRHDSYFAFFRMELFGLPFTIILRWMSRTKSYY